MNNFNGMSNFSTPWWPRMLMFTSSNPLFSLDWQFPGITTLRPLVSGYYPLGISFLLLPGNGDDGYTKIPSLKQLFTMGWSQLGQVKQKARISWDFSPTQTPPDIPTFHNHPHNLIPNSHYVYPESNPAHTSGGKVRGLLPSWPRRGKSVSESGAGDTREKNGVKS